MFEMGAKLGDGWDMDPVCPKCRENRSECTCQEKKEILPPEKHLLVFRFEKRKGKPVTLVGPFCLEQKTLKETAKKVKKKLGIGGAVKEEWMEFQGDVKEKLKESLQSMQFRFKTK